MTAEDLIKALDANDAGLAAFTRRGPEFFKANKRPFRNQVYIDGDIDIDGLLEDILTLVARERA